MGYDATALAAMLARRAVEADRVLDYSQSVLTQHAGFAGVDGIFRFLENGEVERSLAILEVRRDDFKVLEVAPSSFRPLVN